MARIAGEPRGRVRTAELPQLPKPAWQIHHQGRQQYGRAQPQDSHLKGRRKHSFQPQLARQLMTDTACVYGSFSATLRSRIRNILPYTVNNGYAL
jgi:hypothetical protein